jgi:hypothetical protein
MADGSANITSESPPWPMVQGVMERLSREDSARYAAWLREGEYCNGHQPGGCVPAIRTDAELEAAARREIAALAAYRASPVGRLRKAIAELEDTRAYGEEVWTMRGLLDRSDNKPSPAGVGAILAVLAQINTPTARQAIEACAELLLGMEARRAA